MKKLLFAGVVTALALSGVANAQTTMGGTTNSDDTMGHTGTMGSTDTMDHDKMGSTGAMDANSMAMMGKVTNVDKKKNMVTIEVPISPTAPVMRDGKTVGLDQLKKGDDIRANFDPATNAITQIQVAPKDHPMNKTQKDQMNR
jgi:hypothetical protein